MMQLNTLAMIALFAIAIALLFALLPRQPYKRAPLLFTPAERNFFRQLVRAVDGDYLVFGKVRVGDLVTIKAKYGSKGSMRDLSKVAQKHVDFCLCDPESLAVICAIELNDKSHERMDRRSRDCFLNTVFKDVGLPIVWVKAQNSYNPMDIRQAIQASIESVLQSSASIPKEFRKSRT
jgi:hypothetical protein